MCTSQCEGLDHEQSKNVNTDDDDYTTQQHLLETWIREQEDLKKKLILFDTEEWQTSRIVAPVFSSNVKTKENLLNVKGKKIKKQEKSAHEQHFTKEVSLHKENSSNTLEEAVRGIGKMCISQENSDEKYCSSFVEKGILKYIAGVDVSYVKDSKEKACAAFVIIRLPDFKVVYEDIKIISISVPYIPGYLAFREVGFLVDMVDTLQMHSSPYFPQAILMDGNGILHPRGFGAACHLGVLLNIPTVGAAKNLHKVDGLLQTEDFKNSEALQQAGDVLPLKDASGKILGAALRTSQSAKNPIYVSQGHRCSLDTALWLIQVCCQYRIPEPIRQADIRSREYLRVHNI